MTKDECNDCHELYQDEEGDYCEKMGALLEDMALCPDDPSHLDYQLESYADNLFHQYRDGDITFAQARSAYSRARVKLKNNY